MREPLALMSNGAPVRAGSGRHSLKAATPVSRQQSLSTATTHASSETATFLSFVRLLSSKSEEEQRMLMQVAMNEAATAPPPARRTTGAGVSPGLRRTGSAGGDLRRNPLRRSASLDGSDFGGRANGGAGGFAIVSGAAAGCSADPQSAAGLDGRPRSADAAAAYGNGAVMWGGSQFGERVSTAGGRGHPLRQRQAQARAAAAAAQLQQQFIRRAAAATLQAHWRGWQHRRLARYLRARRKRAMRLDWLWHLEYVTNLMHWHEAAHTVQATWRGRRDAKSAPKRTAAAGSDSREPSQVGGAPASQSTAASLPSPPPAETAGADGATDGVVDGAAVAATATDQQPQGTSGAAGGTAADKGHDAAAPAGGGKRRGGKAAAAAGRRGIVWKDVGGKDQLSEIRTYVVNNSAPPRW